MKTGDPVIDNAYRDFLANTIAILSGLEHEDPATLTITTKAMLLAGYSQTEIAASVGVSRPTISRWCNGSRHLPRSPIARKAMVGELIGVLSERYKKYT